MKFQIGDIVLFWGEVAAVEMFAMGKIRIGLSGQQGNRFNCEWPIGMWPPDRWVSPEMLAAHQIPWAFDRTLGGWTPDTPAP